MPMHCRIGLITLTKLLINYEYYDQYDNEKENRLL